MSVVASEGQVAGGGVTLRQKRTMEWQVNSWRVGYFLSLWLCTVDRGVFTVERNDALSDIHGNETPAIDSTTATAARDEQRQRTVTERSRSRGSSSGPPLATSNETRNRR